MVQIKVGLNGRAIATDVPGHYTLLRWLRECQQAYEVKDGCSEGVCGACTVLVDGRAVTACVMLAAQVDGAEIETSAALREDGDLGLLQRCFWETGGSQCGFCTQGILMSATELLRRGTPCTRAEIREHLHGNLCRCTGYQAIVDAVEMAAREGSNDAEGEPA